jgi:hypothetical protein
MVFKVKKKNSHQNRVNSEMPWKKNCQLQYNKRNQMAEVFPKKYAIGEGELTFAAS